MEKPVLDIVNVADPRKVINLINHYKEFLKTENIKTIGYVAMQRQILKKFKDMENFIEIYHFITVKFSFRPEAFS